MGNSHIIIVGIFLYESSHLQRNSKREYRVF